MFLSRSILQGSFISLLLLLRVTSLSFHCLIFLWFLSSFYRCNFTFFICIIRKVKNIYIRGNCWNLGCGVSPPTTYMLSWLILLFWLHCCRCMHRPQPSCCREGHRVDMCPSMSDVLYTSTLLSLGISQVWLTLKFSWVCWICQVLHPNADLIALGNPRLI